MLNILLKKQIAEIFRSYTYDAKKNKARSKAATIGFIVMFVILMVGVIGGMCGALAYLICQTMVAANLGWLYFDIMGLIAMLLGVIGSVFNTYSGLYLSKDNDLLLSMPIPVKSIMAARLLGVYLMGLMYSGVIMLPATVVYWITAPLTLGTVIGPVVMTAVISVLDLVLSCLLGLVVAKISLKLKNKSFITVIIFVVFFAAYYWFYFNAQSFINNLLKNAVIYGEAVKDTAYPVYLFGNVGTGNALAMSVFAVVSAVLFIIMYLIMARSFIKIATSTGNIKKNTYNKESRKGEKVKSPAAALLQKEFKRITTNPTYMINCALGVLLFPVGGIAVLIKAKPIFAVICEIFGRNSGAATIIAASLVFMLGSSICTAAPSISLEGRNLWILQSLPIEPLSVLKAKCKAQFLLMTIPCVFFVLCVGISMFEGVLNLLLLICATVMFSVLWSLFGLFLGVKMPNLNWTNEITPIKQSLNVMIAFFGGWVFAAAFAVIYFFFGKAIGSELYLLITTALSAALSALLYGWIKSKGTAQFAKL